jgi:hypothetical protein
LDTPLIASPDFELSHSKQGVVFAHESRLMTSARAGPIDITESVEANATVAPSANVNFQDCMANLQDGRGGMIRAYAVRAAGR